MRRKTLLAALTLLASVGCVTERQVKAIVANSNAAMVDVPDLAQSVNDVDPKRLDAALGQIESLINNHPDQTVLVNTLRVRQTMLLAVHGRYEAATIALGKVSSRPVSERDGALYDLGEHVVWWFEKSKSFGDADVTHAWNNVLPAFDKTCGGLTEGSEIRYYLETMRAMIELTAANKSTPLGPPAVRRELERRMASSLARLAARFDRDQGTADRDWVAKNWDKIETAEEMPLAQLRARVWLRSAMHGYFRTAARIDRALQRIQGAGTLKPQWAPEWVAAQAQVWATANPPPSNNNNNN